MEKKINSREMAAIKRIAQNVDAYFTKVNKLNAKIEELVKERDELQAEIDEMEAPVIRKTGMRSTDMFEKVVTPYLNADGTTKKDKDGRVIKVTKYVPKTIEVEPQLNEVPEVEPDMFN